MAEAVVTVREFLTCPVCGYRKIHRRDKDSIYELQARSGGFKCEGECAYGDDAKWRAASLVWTDTIEVYVEWPTPTWVGEITSGTMTMGDGTERSLVGGKLMAHG